MEFAPVSGLLNFFLFMMATNKRKDASGKRPAQSRGAKRQALLNAGKVKSLEEALGEKDARDDRIRLEEEEKKAAEAVALKMKESELHRNIEQLYIRLESTSFFHDWAPLVKTALGIVFWHAVLVYFMTEYDWIEYLGYGVLMEDLLFMNLKWFVYTQGGFLFLRYLWYLHTRVTEEWRFVRWYDGYLGGKPHVFKNTPTLESARVCVFRHRGKNLQGKVVETELLVSATLLAQCSTFNQHSFGSAEIAATRIRDMCRSCGTLDLGAYDFTFRGQSVVRNTALLSYALFQKRERETAHISFYRAQ